MKSKKAAEQAGHISSQAQEIRDRALERIREGAVAADRMVHRNTYNVLAAGIVVGFVALLPVYLKHRAERQRAAAGAAPVGGAAAAVTVAGARAKKAA